MIIVAIETVIISGSFHSKINVAAVKVIIHAVLSIFIARLAIIILLNFLIPPSTITPPIHQLTPIKINLSLISRNYYVQRYS